MLKPIQDKVLVKVDKEEIASSSGFLLTATGEKQGTGVVIAKGPGLTLSDGDFIEIECEVGDRVAFSKYSGTEIEHEGQELTILAYRDILAIIG
jgi:chaperonin GroES